ncbi:MAG TPA: LysR family transcriptional regulator [Verrucomicrobiae bacterium]|nr:LysR family transcriptional regulator [Verrucomicrobiae bacterium]
MSSVSTRLRIMVGDQIAFGPGKAELLALIGETGSIGEAARRMDMSYTRAWKLVQTMNGCFNVPLITAMRGGQERGGAVLTETGRRVLELYQKMEAEAFKGSQRGWRTLQKFLRN